MPFDMWMVLMHCQILHIYACNKSRFTRFLVKNIALLKWRHFNNLLLFIDILLIVWQSMFRCHINTRQLVAIYHRREALVHNEMFINGNKNPETQRGNITVTEYMYIVVILSVVLSRRRLYMMIFGQHYWYGPQDSSTVLSRMLHTLWCGLIYRYMAFNTMRHTCASFNWVIM